MLTTQDKIPLFGVDVLVYTLLRLWGRPPDRGIGMTEGAQQQSAGSQADTLQAAAASADQEFPASDAGNCVASCLTFIEILVRDEDGEPVTNQQYHLVLTDGSVQEGQLGADGRIFVDSIPHGDCQITFKPMIDYGVPEREVKRSWESEDAQGDVPDIDEEQFASTGD
jgi:hypothetical protein